MQELYQAAIEFLRKRDALLESEAALSRQIEDAPSRIRQYRMFVSAAPPRRFWRQRFF